MTLQAQKFAQRLAQVCDLLRLPPGHGRQTELAKLCGVSPNAARKWLHGQSYPEMHRAVALCDEAHVSVLWLLQGAGPMLLPPGDPVADSVGRAVAVLPEQASREVADFVRYKLGNVTQLKVNEPPAKYSDAIGRALSDD